MAGLKGKHQKLHLTALLGDFCHSSVGHKIPPAPEPQNALSWYFFLASLTQRNVENNFSPSHLPVVSYESKKKKIEHFVLKAPVVDKKLEVGTEMTVTFKVYSRTMGILYQVHTSR